MSLTALSPLDGRYAKKVRALAGYFSELALMRYRLMVEIEYFIALSLEKKIKEFPPLKPAEQKKLRNLYAHFSLADAQRVKEFEATTNHDVKALEYFIKACLPARQEKIAEFIHFALTSEDINNLAYSTMWQTAVRKEYLPKIQAVDKKIAAFASAYSHTPLLALTHGQSATPTTVGKEFAVFNNRLHRQIKQLTKHQLQGKLNGATGTWSAHAIAYPRVNWLKFSEKFVKAMNLKPNLITTQIENHDSLAESYDIIQRINTILLDFTRDIWLYVMRGVLGQEKKAGETGSSTMPHKINPIHFENAEGNLGLANAYFSHLARKLPVSRLQRDLSDSTVLRNQGTPLGHSFLACQSILTGLSRLTINKTRLNEELEDHWEILAEAIQVILRKVGYPKPYEKLKELARGERLNKKSIQEFIKSLNIPKPEKQKLLRLTPQTYTGLAGAVAKISRAL